MKKALGYRRVSGKSQAKDGTGLDEQTAQCTEWAARNGYVIVEWFTDAGVSGELPWRDRPGMAALVQRVAVNGIDSVIVHMMDRITRGKAEIAENFLAMVQASGVQVISVIDGVLTDVEGDEFKSADAELVRTIKQGIVRAEKRKLVARMALGRLRAKAAGKRVDGPHYFGHDVRKPDEKAALVRMKEWQASGLTFYAIAKKLNDEGIPTRNAAKKKLNDEGTTPAPKWREGAVRKILTREGSV